MYVYIYVYIHIHDPRKLHGVVKLSAETLFGQVHQAVPLQESVNFSHEPAQGPSRTCNQSKEDEYRWSHSFIMRCSRTRPTIQYHVAELQNRVCIFRLPLLKIWVDIIFET